MRQQSLHVYAIRACTIIIFSTLFSCVHVPNYTMDDATKQHPATAVFLNYAKDVKRAANFEALATQYFTKRDQEAYNNAMGWQRFGYSASYKALTNGHCQTIKLFIASLKRARIDCGGTIKVESYYIDASIEKMHLRVYLVSKIVEGQERWYIERSGYRQTQEDGTGKATTGIGLKFKADFTGIELPKTN